MFSEQNTSSGGGGGGNGGGGGGLNFAIKYENEFMCSLTIMLSSYTNSLTGTCEAFDYRAQASGSYNTNKRHLKLHHSSHSMSHQLAQTFTLLRHNKNGRCHGFFFFSLPLVIIRF